MIGIYTNLNRDKNLEVTKLLVSHMAKAGLPCCAHCLLRGSVDCRDFFDENDGIQNLEMMIALGGDGTMLSASQFCSKHDIPIIGINLGKVGFLAEIEVSDIKSFVGRLVSKEYSVAAREMLSVSFNGNSFDALNEISISRNRAEKSINFQVFVKGEGVSTFFGDGFLVSTPTGSTAYSLSAGGPIVSADVPCWILTPLNAHSLFSRSIIVDNSEEIVVAVDNCVSIIADGRLVGTTDGEIIINKSGKVTRFVIFNESNFYSKLRIKLGSISILPEEN